MRIRIAITVEVEVDSEVPVSEVVDEARGALWKYESGDRSTANDSVRVVGVESVRVLPAEGA